MGARLTVVLSEVVSGKQCSTQRQSTACGHTLQELLGNMAKRARRVKDDDDSEYDESYASSAPAARARSRPRTPRTKKPGTSQAPKSKLDGVIATKEGVIVASQGPRHGASRHRIADPAPLRCALLRWYARVHESRGMPWRKAYDPTFGPAERAQRAYEVRCSRTPFFLRSGVLITERAHTHILCRSGYPRSCCSRLRLRRSYHTTIDGWQSSSGRTSS